MSQGKITKSDMDKIAKLSELSIGEQEKDQYAEQMEEILGFVGQLKKLNVEEVKETNQVTGLTSVMREDRIDEERCLSQEEALSQARASHNGYVLVPAILNKRE